MFFFNGLLHIIVLRIYVKWLAEMTKGTNSEGKMDNRKTAKGKEKARKRRREGGVEWE